MIRSPLRYISIFILFNFVINQQTIDKNSMLRINDKKQNANSAAFKKFTRAKSLEKAGLWEDAEKLYKEINIEEPGEIRYFSPLKNILKQRREWEELIKFTKAYADVNINNPKAFIELGEVYIWAGKMDKARKTFDPILKKSKKNPNIIKMIISKYAQNGSFDESEKILKESRNFLEMPAFYSMEMARFYSNRMAYDKSLSEYILYLSKNPSRLDFVSERVVGFLSSPDVASILIKDLKKESSIESKRILADIYFNQKEFDDAYEILKNVKIEIRHLLDFATDLIEEGQFVMAEQVLGYIYNSKRSDQNIIEKSIFNLAVIYEKKTVRSIDPLPISGFYKKNSFFENNYLSLDEDKAESLNQAINIYDSLITKTNSIEANYRLGEIRYRILGDLDGAVKHYNSIINKRNNKKYLVDSIIRLVDIYIAKGNMKKADQVIQKYKKDSRLQSMNTDLFIKQAQIYFYEGRLDTLTSFIKDKFSDLELVNDWHNDILELRSLLFNFDKKPELFVLFADSQLLLKKNKREESLRKMYQILESSDPPLMNLIKYQASYILMLQGNYLEAIELVDNLEGESLYIELSYILKGEIFDFLLNDVESAIDYYLIFLENYPNSIFYDQIRLRLRELVG